MAKLAADFHFNYWIALTVSLGLAAGAGALCELTLRRIFNRQRVLVMVATIGLSQVLFLFTALPFVRPKKLAQPFPVPINLTFSINGFAFTSGQVLTLIVAPIVALSIAAFVKFSPWGLAMRAMSENADSARLSGVWVRRTSTVAWTLAGVLSAFAAILNAPGRPRCSPRCSAPTCSCSRSSPGSSAPCSTSRWRSSPGSASASSSSSSTGTSPTRRRSS